MKSLANRIDERFSEKVFLRHDTLWISYNPGSGITAQLPDIKKYFTNKRGDSNYDHIVDEFVKWAKNETPIFKKSNTNVFKIPKYERLSGYSYSDLSIWGGVQTPSTHIYMTVYAGDDGVVVINFFKTLKEAKNWIS